MKLGHYTYHYSEIIWLRSLLKCLQVDYYPTLVYRKNENALHIRVNLIFHERTKYNEMNCYLICEHFKILYL